MNILLNFIWAWETIDRRCGCSDQFVLKPFAGNKKVSMWLINSFVGRDPPNKHTNKLISNKQNTLVHLLLLVSWYSVHLLLNNTFTIICYSLNIICSIHIIILWNPQIICTKFVIYTLMFVAWFVQRYVLNVKLYVR